MSTFTLTLAHPWAGSVPNHDNKYNKVVDEAQQMMHRPDSGKSTRLGRKVEKPGDRCAGGPSGQTDTTKHDKQHANK